MDSITMENVVVDVDVVIMMTMVMDAIVTEESVIAMITTMIVTAMMESAIAMTTMTTVSVTAMMENAIAAKRKRFH